MRARVGERESDRHFVYAQPESHFSLLLPYSRKESERCTYSLNLELGLYLTAVKSESVPG